MKILHLIDTLDAGEGTRRLQLLGPALAPDASLQVCSLGPDTAWSAELRQAGIVVHTLGWTRWFDPSVLWNLRTLLREAAPEVIHVWSLSALRALAVVAPGLLPRVVMSAALPAVDKLAWWDRRLLECVRIQTPTGFVRTEPERRRGASAGLGSVRIACAGRLERDYGFRQAIWAFDFLLFLHPDAKLDLVGVGAQEPALQTLTQGLHNRSSVRFLGALPDVAPVLSEADIVWVPSLANVGQQAALEAMALGKAVVASDVPCLRAVIRDGESGLLVPPNDVIALARRTYALMEDQRLRERIGEAARQHVQHQFSVGAAVEQWREVYRSVAA